MDWTLITYVWVQACKWTGKRPYIKKSKFQPAMALSLTEAEYMASTEAIKEAIWLERLLHELKLWFILIIKM